jgi:hypothetical protein
MSARNALSVAALALLMLPAAGCGASKSLSIASLTTTSSAASRANTARSGSAPSQTQLQQEALNYSRCMRSNGVPNFPDPQPGGGFVFRAGAGVDPSSPAFEAARAKCQKQIPLGGPTPGSTTHPSRQWLAQMIKAAQCMRRHGISGFPDPKTSVPSNPFPPGSGVGVISDIEGAIFVFPDTLDMQSSLFVHAAAACKFPLHNH